MHKAAGRGWKWKKIGRRECEDDATDVSERHRVSVINNCVPFHGQTRSD